MIIYIELEVIKLFIYSDFLFAQRHIFEKHL